MTNYYNLMLENWMKSKDLQRQAREHALREEAFSAHKCEYPEVKSKRPRWQFLDE